MDVKQVAVDGVRDVEPYESVSQRNNRITSETQAQQSKMTQLITLLA
jgi:hypothetical protein